MRTVHFISLAILITVASSPTVAQDTSTGYALEEVIVTARYTEESLQDAGLGIDVFEGSMLKEQGITDGIGLSDSIPALNIINTGGSSINLVMRGVGNRGIGPSAEASVIFNYDGVALARITSALVGLYDLERVEVLKGPQGTLYGKNSTGGVVSVVPVKPELDEWGGFVDGSVGNYSALDLSSAVNAPIGDKAALRVSGKIVDSDGWSNDGTNDVEKQNIRGQLLVEPSDRLSVRLAAEFGHVGGTGPTQTPYAIYTRNGPGDYSYTLTGQPIHDGPFAPATTALRTSTLVPPAFTFQSPIDTDLFIDNDALTLNAEIVAEFDAGTLTVIPAYAKTSTDAKLGGGFRSILATTDAEQTSIEARFAGSVAKFDYIVGVHYISEDISSEITINLDAILPIQSPSFDNESIAGFSAVTFNLDETTRLIAGARYGKDKKDFSTANEIFILACGAGPVPTGPEIGACMAPGAVENFTTIPGGPQAYFDYWNDNLIVVPGLVIPVPGGTNIRPLLSGLGSIIQLPTSIRASAIDEKEPSYRFSVEKDLFSDSLLYATFSKGYRVGGFDASGNAFDSEFLKAYTIGLKNRFLDNRLQLNAEIFWWDYTDQQISYNSVNAAGGAEAFTQNVGESTIKGAEIDAVWLAAENTLVSTTVQHLDATYDDLHFIAPSTGDGADNINCPFVDTGMVTAPGPGGGAPILDFNCSGSRSVLAPKWVVRIGVEQTFPLSNGYQIVASVDSTYTSEQQSNFFERPVDIIESHTKTNINVTLQSPDGGWYVRAFARNLENKHRVEAVENPLTNVSYVKPRIDRTYGIRVGMNF